MLKNHDLVEMKEFEGVRYEPGPDDARLLLTTEGRPDLWSEHRRESVGDLLVWELP